LDSFWMHSNHVPEVCKRIWDGYVLYVKSAAVTRRGVEALGLADSLGGSGKEVVEAFFYRGESDLEHQAKVGWLTLAFLNNFPGFFGELPNRSGFQPEVWSLLTVALCHDIGEVGIGDIPDDGRPEHDLKNDTEFKVFKILMRAFCSYNAGESIAVFERFQQKRPSTGAALFMLDKLEAVLTLLFLEKHGAVGNLENKASLTAQDKYFMKAAESNNPADVWAIHFKLVAQGGFSKNLSEPVLKMMETAFVDVRGELPKWWDKEVPPYEK